MAAFVQKGRSAHTRLWVSWEGCGTTLEPNPVSPVKWHLETWDRLGRDFRREVRACVGAGGGRPSQDLWADSCRVTVVLQGWATFQEGPGPSFLSWGGRKGSSIACKLPYLLLLGHQACLPHCSPSVPGRPVSSLEWRKETWRDPPTSSGPSPTPVFS